MYFRTGTIWLVSSIVVLGVSYSGCAGQKKSLKDEISLQSQTIDDLQKQNAELQAKVTELESQKAAPVAGAAESLEGPRHKLEQDLKGTGTTVKAGEGTITVVVSSAKLFRPGQVTLMPAAKGVLSKVCRAVQTNFPEATVRIEGHTDSSPIKKLKDKYKSNWELSASRAASVLHYFIESCHMDPKKVYLAGRGEYHPIASNKSASGRQKNRRVEIVIIPREGL